MSGVRVLVGTRKGAFVLTSDGKRERLGRQRPPLRGLGDLPPEGLAGRPEPALRVAVEQLVRAGDPALRRRRPDLGAGGQRVQVRGRPRHAPVVRRHAAPLGVRARLAPRAVADRPGHGLRRRRGRGAVPLERRRHRPGRSSRACAATARARAGSRAPAGCACTRSCCDPSDPGRIVHRDLVGGRVPQRRRRQDLAADQPRACAPSRSPTRRPRSATACTASRCTRRARTCCSCRSTGT